MLSQEEQTLFLFFLSKKGEYNERSLICKSEIMGLFSLMGSGGGKKITPQEFKRDIRSELYSKGLSHRDIDHVAQVADGSLFEPGRYRGIDRREKEQIIKTLRDNKSSHTLSDHQIDLVDETLSHEL